MMTSRQNPMLIAAALCAVVMMAGVYYWQTRKKMHPLTVRAPDKQAKPTENDREADAGYVVVGGVRRPASDVPDAQKRPSIFRNTTTKEVLDPGSAPPLRVEDHPSVKLVVDAFRNQTHPERLSPLISPAPFDADAFTRDPQAYLTVVEPGRVFQTAQPGPGVPVLRPLNPHRVRIQQGESVKLKVRAAPNVPVTFTSFDMGAFANTLTSISVQADANAIAEAEFFGTPGTYNDVNILVGSPASTGQVHYVVHIQLPQRSSDSAAKQQK